MEEPTQDQPTLWHMVMSPHAQFKKMRQYPVFALPMVTLCIFYLIGTWFAMLGVNFQDIEQIEGISSKTVITLTTAFTFLFAFVKPVLITVLLAAIYFGCGKVMKTQVPYQHFVAMNTHIWIIAGVGVIVNGIITAIIGTNIDNVQQVHISLASLIQSEGMMRVVLGKIEFFAIWVTVLTAIGLSAVADFSKKSAWLIALSGFVLNGLAAMVWYNLSHILG